MERLKIFGKKLVNFVWSRAFLINFLAVALIYVVGFYILTSQLDSSTHHGTKIEVPNLIGTNAKDVEAKLNGSELKYEVFDSIYDPSKVEGTILQQDPEPTTVSLVHVKPGRTIKLSVSKRSMLVEMPNLVDRSQRFAEGILRNRGFSYNLSYQPTREAHGAVLDQLYKGKSIKSGTKIPIGSRIKLIVGRNEAGVPIQLPNLYGMTIVEAKKTVDGMLNMEFFVGACEGCVTKADSSSARVYVQSPEFEEGAVVASGGSITVVAKKDFVEAEPPQ